MIIFYSGYGSNWNAMKAVLHSKLNDPVLQQSLLSTGDAFLLEHNSVKGRDAVWSNNYDGTGTNWLGYQSMILRAELNQNRHQSKMMCDFVDLHDSSRLNDEWQNLVLEATKTIHKALGTRY